MNFEIKKVKTDEKLFAIHLSTNIYTGGSSCLLKDNTNNKILYKHSKSITHITSSLKYLASSSYDCTVSVFKRIDNEDRNDNSSYFDKKGERNSTFVLEDIIEGPETEIKGISFDNTDKWLALATRGKTVWICSIEDYTEIDKILEDHSEDVKGCIFYSEMLFTFGYDNTIKIYQFFEIDQTWELVQSIEEYSTIWNIIFIEDRMYSCNDNGEINMYILDKGWTLKKKLKISVLPIMALSNFRDILVCTVNVGNLVFLNRDLEVVHTIERLHNDIINCIHWSEKDDLVGTCSDDQCYCILRPVFK
jgi:WD40 repeat protein